MGRWQEVVLAVQGVQHRCCVVQDGLILDNELVEVSSLEVICEINRRATVIINLIAGSSLMDEVLPAMVCDLAKRCLEVGKTAGLSSTAVCGLVCDGLAATSAMLLPLTIGEEASVEGNAEVAGLFEPLGQAMDGFSFEVFVGLLRLEELLKPRWELIGNGQGGTMILDGLREGAEFGSEEDLSEEYQQYVALQGVCVWTLALAVRAVGYNQFTGRVLWEYASGGPLGVQVFAKSALCFQTTTRTVPWISEHVPYIREPSDLLELRHAILGAVLGLISQDVAFANACDAEDGNISIDVRNRTLFKHHATLAIAAEQCGLLDCLLAFPWSILPSEPMSPLIPAFASFIATLAHSSLEKPLPMVKQLEVWKEQLYNNSREVWNIVVPPHAKVPIETRGFLRDCAAIAAVAPLGFYNLCAFLDNFQLITSDPEAVAAVVVICANTGCSPGSDSLSAQLSLLEPNMKMLVATRLQSWNGPLKSQSNLDLWTPLLNVTNTEAPRGEADAHALKAQGTAGVGDCGTQEPENGLRELVVSAPPEFCCQLDGRLLVDPVRTPSGYVFERSVLARYLKASKWRCPFTGAALALSECHRDAELRMRIVQWVRQSQPRQKPR